MPRGTWDTPGWFELFAYRVFTFCDGPFQAASAKSIPNSDGSPATPSTQPGTQFVSNLKRGVPVLLSALLLIVFSEYLVECWV